VGAAGIRLERVSKRFSHRVKGPVYAVREVSLAVRPGELLTLLGPSGCGKTTTLRMIAGFERPDAGRVVIEDQDVTELMANRRGIGFVFQNYALFPHLTVFENVAYGLRVRRMAGAALEAAVRDVVELVGLRGYEGQFPHQLSGGEQQRVALARAIVIRPRVLLLDEPLSNLDARLRVQMRREIQELQKRLSITAVYVTHDQEEAMAISDRIVVMNQGAIAQEGTAEALYREPASEFVAQFIGRANLLDARVVAVEADATTLEVRGARLRRPGRSPAAEPGRSVRLVVRPEALDLVPEGREGLRGTVLSRVFLGEKVEYQVRAGEDLFQVTAYTPGRVFAPRDPVTLVIRPEAVALLPGPA
jgi:iron(III) transport system ATP-binding protein